MQGRYPDIIHLVSNRSWGGGEQFVLNLSHAFRNIDKRVIIFCRNTAVVAPRFADFLPDVYHLPLRGYIDIHSPFILARKLNSLGAVIIHTHNFKDAWTAVTARSLSRNPDVRILMTRHLVRTTDSSVFIKHILSKLDALVFVSECARQAFLSTNPPIGTDKIRVIYNGVEDPATPPVRNYDTLINLLYHGRIAPEKGLDTLICAFAEIKNPKLMLTIAGSGESEYLAFLHRLAASLNIENRIKWPGFQSDMTPLLAQSHIGIIPSRVDEACPLSAAECLAWGIPVVCSDKGALKELVNDGISGILVPPNNPSALAEALRSIICDPKQLVSMSNNARERYLDNFTFSRMFNSYSNLYAEL